MNTALLFELAALRETAQSRRPQAVEQLIRRLLG